jgi:hypothetical protein
MFYGFMVMVMILVVGLTAWNIMGHIDERHTQVMAELSLIKKHLGIVDQEG